MTMLNFFDIDSALPGHRRSWSPSTLKTRLLLNYRSIPYTHTFVSFPDIKPLLIDLGVAAFGETYYALPAIHHSASIPASSAHPKSTINESLLIALHLEEAFPPSTEHPSVFPLGDASYALAVAVQRLVDVQIVPASYKLILRTLPSILDPRGATFFRRDRAEDEDGVAPEDLCGPDSEVHWTKTKRALFPLVTMLKGRAGVKKGPFLEGGDTPSYADFILVAFFGWVERSNVEDWETLMNMGEGEFRELWEACEWCFEGMGEGERAWEWKGKGGEPEHPGE